MSNELIPVNTKLNWKGVMPNAIRKHRSNTPAIRPHEVTPGAVNQILRDTADFFEKGGAKWCQGGIGNNVDEVCLVGAVLRMESGDIDNIYYETQPQRHPLTTAAVAKLAQHLNKVNEVKALPPPDHFHDMNFTHVSDWNDIAGRSKAEVVMLLRQAAED